jgi:hypothetical protein
MHVEQQHTYPAAAGVTTAVLMLCLLVSREDHSAALSAGELYGEGRLHCE